MSLDITSNDLVQERSEWNEYWNKKNRGGVLYSLIAEFYRKVIIRPNLNYFIRKYFKPGSVLLHAGCGSGQVDQDICKDFKIIGMDISPRALEIYKETNATGETLLSSIFSIQKPDKSLDGIYNLGVMEHFTESQIQQTLVEFRRVLKDNGHIVLFWPPEFGLSVLFFKFMVKATKIVFRKDVKFHPDEISRVQSKKDVTAVLKKGGFDVAEYSFGPKDVFTYSIIVGRKSA